MPIKPSRERGDTLIEVLIALSVLAVVTVGSFSIMNKGVVLMYDGMERTEVRQLLDRQIESLNYARDQYLRQQTSDVVSMTAEDKAAVPVWTSIKTVPSGSTPVVANCSDTTNAFSIKRGTTDGIPNIVQYVSGVTRPIAPGFPAPGDGIWMQKVNSLPSAKIPYIDFYIRVRALLPKSSHRS